MASTPNAQEHFARLGPKGRKPPQVGTIGNAIANGHHMTVYCDAMGCRNKADVNLEAMREQLGADYRVADFVARGKCSRCGARWPQISIRVAPINTGGFR